MRYGADRSGIPTASPAHHGRWIRLGAAMAAIAFDTAHQAGGRLEAAHMPGDEPASAPLQFQPLDPGIVSEAIPAFFIGRNKQGFWVARDAKGQIGGIFLLEDSALSFARRHSRPAGCATIFPSERFELDLKNNGNSLVPYLGSLVRANTASTRMATIKRFCLCALLALILASVVGGLIALKTAAYFWRFHN
jgi:hypothetical protein